MNEIPKEKLSQISRDEVDVVNDIRELNFGRINIVIQDGVIVSKEITRVVKNGKNRNRGNRQNVGENKNVSSGSEYGNNEERIYQKLSQTIYLPDSKLSSEFEYSG